MQELVRESAPFGRVCEPAVDQYHLGRGVVATPKAIGENGAGHGDRQADDGAAHGTVGHAPVDRQVRQARRNPAPPLH